MTIKEVSQDLRMPEQAVRERLKRGLYPFGDAIKYEGSSKWTYQIYEERYKLWKEGRL